MGALGHTELWKGPTNASSAHRPLGIARPVCQRTGGGEGMNKGQNLVNETLEMVGDRANAEVVADTGISSLTRFANSFIHQNVSEDIEDVALKVEVDGKVASAKTTATTPDALARFVDATLETAANQPVDDDTPDSLASGRKRVVN